MAYSEGWSTERDHPIDDDLCEDCRDCCGDSDDCCEDCRECECREQQREGVAHQTPPPVATKPNQWSTKTGGSEMNSTIVKLYEKTADAVLVNKFFGHLIRQDAIEVIKLQGKEKAILEAAKDMQVKQDAARNVVSARITV